MFDATMTRLVSTSDLQEIWDGIVLRAGAFASFHSVANSTHSGYFLCNVISRHVNSGVNLRVVFSGDGLIAGLFIDGYPNISDISDGLSEPVVRDGFTDYPVVVGEGTLFPLSGILSMPDNVDGRVPAVVLVHGSGAHDMDSTLFSNKPFRDIADYLAANGIAVIRYDKRSHAHGASFPEGFTVWEEVIEDAVLATNILKADPRIDEGKVFIVGLSLGGMLAPRIHVEGGDFAGLILLAGSPRFLLDISKTQNILTIEATMEGMAKQTALSQIEDEWDSQIHEFLRLSDDVAKATPIPGFGASAYYFKDLYNNPASAFIDRVTVPFLVMQGSDDLQVLADIDFVLYQELLAGRANVSFNLYEGLNHLFMPSTGRDITELMDEYAIEARVDSQVLADIALWIHGQ